MRMFSTMTKLQHISEATPVPSTTSSTEISTPSPSTLTPVDMFRRGIKLDPSVYLTLKDGIYNDNWHCSLADQSRAQDGSDVLNPVYLPVTPNQKYLFQENKNTCMSLWNQKWRLPKVN
jgi:hypothetical protein